MKAVAYIRVSTDRQELGPRAQVRAIREWAKANGVTIARWRFDRGVSGGADLADRPQLMAAMEDVALHEAGLFVVQKRDRLARDIYNAGAIESAIRRLGAKVVAVDREDTGDEATDLIQKTIEDLFAHLERIRIKCRTRAALAVKKARGERLGAPRFGIEVVPAIQDGSGRRRQGTAIEVETEQEAIGRIIELRADGLSAQQIARVLVGAKVPTKRGGTWTACQVIRILQRVAA